MKKTQEQLLGLVSVFKAASLQHYSTNFEANSRLANSSYSKLCKVAEQLKEQDAMFLLRELFQDESIAVRCWASIFLLNDSGESSNAIGILENISRQKGVLQTSARIVLEQWKSGSFKLGC